MIAVTGAGGFVGQAVCAALRTHAVPVRPLARRAGDGVMGTGDIGPDTDWSAALAGCRAVVHLAARVHVMRDAGRDPLANYRRVNVEGTLALAEQAATLGVRRLLFMSSIKVNGEETEPGRPFREDDEPAPRDPYGVSKLEAEVGLRALSARTGLEVVIIRPPLVYGPGVGANFRAMVKAVASGVPLPFGAVTNKRSLIAVGNLADLVRCAIDHPAATGKPLLASDGQALSTPELLRAIAASLDRPARLISVPPGLLRTAGALIGRRAMMDRLTRSLEVDGSATTRRLGWVPPLTPPQAFAEAAAASWFRSPIEASRRKAD